MGVLLPWDRQNEGNKETSPKKSRRSLLRRMGSIILASVLVAACLMVTCNWRFADFDIVWEIPAGRLLGYRAGVYLIEDDVGIKAVDGEGRTTAADGKTLVLGDEGCFRFTPTHDDERVAAVLDDDLVLTQRQSQPKFGNPWDLLAYRSDRLLWTTQIPGLIFAAYQSDDTIAAGVTDISSGSAFVVSLDVSTGDVLWTKSLRRGSWRSLSLLDSGAVVAVLTTGVTVLNADATVAWDYMPESPVLAAVTAYDTTCIATKTNQTLTSFVYPYKVTALTSAGSVAWVRLIRQEPFIMQQCMGKKAVYAVAENHVLGFEIEDGAKLFVERVPANPVDLAGDKLLVREGSGIRLVKLRSLRFTS